MKTSKFLSLAIGAITLLSLTACSGNSTNTTKDVTPTAIALSSSSIEMEEGATDTLTAVLTPSDATGTITWASQDESVATVSNGIVTGIAAGNTTIVATCGSLSATCAVTINTPKGNYSCLNGSNYYLIYMDDNTAASLGDKVVEDLRPDDSSKFLYVWNNTYTAGTCSGPNAFGEVADWVNMIVTNVGWSGLGFNCTDMNLLNGLATVTDNPNDYYLHIAIKGTSPVTHLFAVDGTAGSAKIVLGPSSFTDNGATYPKYSDYTTDGEWNQIDVPVSYLTKQGLSFTTDNTNPQNVFWALSGGTQGTQLQIDGIFFYKKASE